MVPEMERSGIRKETDSLGEVDVPVDKLWGAQT
jgi:fumarate hydratase class II